MIILIAFIVQNRNDVSIRQKKKALGGKVVCN